MKANKRLYSLLAAAIIATALLVFLATRHKSDEPEWPKSFGFGRTATAKEIATLDIDVRPDGKGLPPGFGSADTGKAIYIAKCAACHGADGKEIKGIKLPGPPLVTSAKGKAKTIGNYWPYATTLFDYLRRAMPYDKPGSLTDNEVYSLTAYLLHCCPGKVFLGKSKGVTEATPSC